MHDPKPTAAVDTPPNEPDEERIAGQGDDLDRGTGLGSSGGSLSKTELNDLKKSGTDPDFDKTLSESKGTTP
jgi:hypothetical protein